MYKVVFNIKHKDLRIEAMQFIIDTNNVFGYFYAGGGAVDNKVNPPIATVSMADVMFVEKVK